MNSLFYAKMAVSNIRKNKKIFFPYIIMGIFSVMMYYMMVSLMNNDGIRKMPYSDNILALLPIGLWVARIFRGGGRGARHRSRWQSSGENEKEDKA